MNVETNTANQVIEVSLKGIEIFSIVASVISIILGIIAIVLSILFYKMSDKSSREIERSAQNIDANLKRLDSIFEKMYSDTFGMVRETVSDMRQHVYKTNGSTEENEISNEIEKRTKDIVSSALEGIHEKSLTKDQIEDLVLKLINQSKNVEQKVKNKTLMDSVKSLLAENNSMTFPQLKKQLFGKNSNNIKGGQLFNVLEEMVELDIIFDPFHIDPEDGHKGIFHDRPIELK